MEVVSNSFLPGDQHLLDSIVSEVKSQGIFDQFRKECFADVDTKPAYQNLRQRVEGSVTAFLREQSWKPDMNKNQVREMLRRRITESGYLERGVERIVDQVVNPKINAAFLKKVEEVVYNYLGIQKPNKDETKPIKTEPLLPTDLEAVSPEPEPPQESVQEKKETVTEDEKMDEDESPPFEPLEEKSLYLATEENSVDSHLSGISGLASHESNQSTENRPFQEFTDENSSSRSDDKKDNLPSGSTKPRGDGDRSQERHRLDKDRNRKHSSSYKDYHREKSRDYKDSRKSDDRDRKYKSSSHGEKRSSSTSSSRDKYGRKESTSSRDRERTHTKDLKSRDRTSTSSSSEKYRRDSKHPSSNSNRKSRDKRKEAKDDHYSSRDKRNDRRSTDRDSNDGQSSKNSFSSGNMENGQTQKSGESSGMSRNNDQNGNSGNSDQTEMKITNQEVNTMNEEDIKNLNTKLVSELEIVPSPLANTVISQDNWDAMEAKLRETIGTEFNSYQEEGDNKVESTSDFKSQVVDEESLENILGQSSDDAEEPEKIEEKTEEKVVESEDCKYFDHVEEKDVEFLTFANNYIAKSMKKKNVKRKSEEEDTSLNNNISLQKKRKVGIEKEDPHKENPVLVFPLPLSPAESDASLDKKEEPPVVVTPVVKAIKKTKVNHQRYSSDDLYKPRPAFMSSRRRNRPLEQ